MPDLPLRLIEYDEEAINEALEDFVGSLSGAISHDLDFRAELIDNFGGFSAVTADIFATGPDLAREYRRFGSIFVRAWAYGDPVRIIYGLVLGAPRAEQREPRRGVHYVRRRLNSILDPFEALHGFTYKTWTNGDFEEWATTSARSLTRQFEPFITFRETSDVVANAEQVSQELELLVELMDQALDQLKPIREFGQAVIMEYYSENLPPASTLADGQAEAAASSDHPEAGPCSLVGVDEPFRRAVTALRSGKHVVLVGPPGTGKTELAKCLCEALGQDYGLTTATSDWTTFDTIGGYLPKADGDGLSFEPGLVLRSFEDEEWLIVDELNRADLDKAFGQLFSLLSGTGQRVRLPYLHINPDGSTSTISIGKGAIDGSDERLYTVPEGWRMLATMNSFDKASLFQLSFALMRRFAFIEVPPPEAQSFKGILTGHPLLADARPGWEEHLDTLLESFTSLFIEEGTSLASVGVPVGPAIPLDMLTYIQRSLQSVEDPEHIAPDYVFLDACAAYLFPQFEGRSLHHDEIRGLVAVAVGYPNSELPPSIEASLRLWTGFEEETR